MEKERKEYRGYEIVRDKQFLTYSVKGIGKGALPKELQGSYTSEKFLRQSVDAYLNKKAA